MAVQQRLKAAFEDVFPHGAFMLGAAEPVEDYDKVREAKEAGRDPGDVQTRDKVSGKRVWAVRILDGDEEARKGQSELNVKIDADHCPVPPDTPKVGPFLPIVLEGVTLTPYIDENGTRPRLSYSIRAQGFADHRKHATAPNAKAAS